MVYKAAKYPLPEVGFVTDRVKDVLDGIRSGFSRIAQEQIWPEYGVFSVRLSFSESYLSDFASSCNLSGYEVSVASEEYSSRIDLKRKTEEQAVTPEDDGWKAARSKFIHQLNFFSQEHLSVYPSHYIEKAGTSYDPGLTWLVRTAGCGGDPRKGDELVSSEVRGLTISLQPKPDQREEMLRDIALGVNELLQEEGLGLKNGFLKINVSFAKGKSDWVNPQGGQKISYYNNGSDRFEVEYLKDGNLLLHSKDLRGIVAKRFENGGDYVWEEEVDLLGLKDVLYLAAKQDSKVKTLYLRTDNGNGNFFVRGHEDARKRLEEALKDICGMETINAGLRIATNLQWEDGVADWEDELNASSSRNGVMFGGSGGMISFVVNGRWSTQAVKDAKDKWNSDGSKDSVLAAFKKQTGDVNWDKVVEVALGESDSPWLYFRQAGLQTESIGWAAESDSKVDKLILDEVHKYGLMREIMNVVKRETIHGFTLSVKIKEAGEDISPEDFLKDLQHRKWWNERKSDMKLENGLFVFESKTSSGSGATKTSTPGDAGEPASGVPTETAGTGTADATKTSTTSGAGVPTETAGTEMADAGKIDVLARSGGVPELEIKSYSDQKALVSEILSVLKLKMEIYEFALKGNGIDNALFEKITKDARYAGCSHTLCKFQYDGTKTGLYFVNGIYDNLRKTDTAELNALRERLKTVGGNCFFGFVGMGFTCPTIFPYDSCNDTKAGFQGVLDNWIVTDVLDYDECPKEVKDELDKDAKKDSDLILEATCFYDPNLYADAKAQAAGDTGTRNYFLHPWLANDWNYRGGRKGHKVEINLPATTKIIEPHDIASEVEYNIPGKSETKKHADFDGRGHLVCFHDGDNYSPNNFIFQIERDGADAWFVSSYTSKGGSTRRIVIHWTFIQDDDGSRSRAELVKRGSNCLSILPCQFSLNPDERSMEAVKVYLEWKKEKKAEKEKEEQLLRALNDATDSAHSFALNKKTLNDDTFDKALSIGKEVWFKFPYAGAGVLAEFFKKRFVDGGKAFDNVALAVDLDDENVVNIWMEFKRKMDKAFGDGGKNVFVHLDKVNNKIWFAANNDMADDEMEKLETPLPCLQVDAKGKLKWTDELKAWWRNPANKVKTFAVALAETPGLKEVDFKEIDEYADLFGDDTDEWKAFRDDEVLHRYRRNLTAFYGCSGVTFTFVPRRENDDIFKSTIDGEGFYVGSEFIDVAQSTWNVTVANKCRAVEDNGKYRLLWNSCAMYLLEAAQRAKITNTEGILKNMLESFAEGVHNAETLDGTPLVVDFTFRNGDSNFDILRTVCKLKELWDALKDQFGKDDSCTFICPEGIKDVAISGGKLLSVLSKEGWQIKHNKSSKERSFEVTGKKDDSAGAPTSGAPGTGAGAGAGAGDEDLGLGDLFGDGAGDGAGAGEPGAGAGAGEPGTGTGAGSGVPAYAFGKNGNCITLPGNFKQDFRDNKFTTEQFCDMLLKYYSDRKTEFDGDKYVEVDLSFYEGMELSNWLDKPSVHEFVEVLINKLEGWSFSLTKKNLAGVFHKCDEDDYEIENDKARKLWIFYVKE
jgi:hypothetical protein